MTSMMCAFSTRVFFSLVRIVVTFFFFFFICFFFFSSRRRHTRSLCDWSSDVCSSDLGDLFMYGIFVGLVAMPLINIASIGTQITEAFAGLDRIREIRKLVTEDSEDGVRAPVGDVRGDVVFEDVSFAYVPGKDVLKRVSFHASPGSTTALVGSSGAGKSTLIGLVLAFSRPHAGQIVVDGRDLATVRLAEYRRQLGVVLQDNFLFDGTIAENIAFARPHATRQEIEAAAR